MFVVIVCPLNVIVLRLLEAIFRTLLEMDCCCNSFKGKLWGKFGPAIGLQSVSCCAIIFTKNPNKNHKYHVNRFIFEPNHFFCTRTTQTLEQEKNTNKNEIISECITFRSKCNKVNLRYAEVHQTNVRKLSWKITMFEIIWNKQNFVCVTLFCPKLLLWKSKRETVVPVVVDEFWPFS